MKKLVVFSGLIIFFMLFLSFNSYAATILINPSDDGSIYVGGGIDKSSYLMPAYSIRGVAEFQIPSIEKKYITKTFLSVNPYALPLWDHSVDVYGYGSNDGILTFADYNAGTYLGTWTLPANMGFYQDAFFDVTDFMSNTTSPYIGFNLRTDGADVFSSLEHNYGHPAQLNVEVVPEPATMVLFGIGTIGMALINRKRKSLTT